MIKKARYSSKEIPRGAHDDNGFDDGSGRSWVAFMAGRKEEERLDCERGREIERVGKREYKREKRMRERDKGNKREIERGAAARGWRSGAWLGHKAAVVGAGGNDG